MDPTLQKLVEELAKIAPALWATLVKQAAFEGIFNVVVGAILIIPLILFWVNIKKIWKWLKDRDEDEWSIGLFVVAMAAYTCLPVTFFSKGVMAIFNPEYYAVKLLLNFIK